MFRLHYFQPWGVAGEPVTFLKLDDVRRYIAHIVSHNIIRVFAIEGRNELAFVRGVDFVAADGRQWVIEEL